MKKYTLILILFQVLNIFLIKRYSYQFFISSTIILQLLFYLDFQRRNHKRRPKLQILINFNIFKTAGNWCCNLITLIPCMSVNQCLPHNLGYKQKIQVIRRNHVYFSSSNVLTDTTVIVKDQMLSEKFAFCFKITIKWNLTKWYATRLK